MQTLSKNWAMTGWRIGWLEAPAELGDMIESLVQFSTSGVPVPSQRAAVAALDGGEANLAEIVERMRTCRDIMAKGLTTTGRARFSLPEGAFYMFCEIAGQPDSRALAHKLIDEAGIGVAPGVRSAPAARAISGFVSPARRARSRRRHDGSRGGWSAEASALFFRPKRVVFRV